MKGQERLDFTQTRIKNCPLAYHCWDRWNSLEWAVVWMKQRYLFLSIVAAEFAVS